MALSRPPRIGAQHPVAHAARIMHQSEAPVNCLALDAGRAGLLACCTRENLSVWSLEQPLPGLGETAGDEATPGARVLLKHTMSTGERKIITHIAVQDGLVVAAGHSKGAKKRKERAGVLSQIVPSVFVLTAHICEDVSALDAGHTPPPVALDVPAGMAQWSEVGGLALARANNGSPLQPTLVIADAHGTVLSMALEPSSHSDSSTPAPIADKRGASQARVQRRSGAGSDQEGGAAEGGAARRGSWMGLQVAHCAQLQGTEDALGKMVALEVHPGAPDLAVAALELAVVVFSLSARAKLLLLPLAGFFPPQASVTACALHLLPNDRAAGAENAPPQRGCEAGTALLERAVVVLGLDSSRRGARPRPAPGPPRAQLPAPVRATLPARSCAPLPVDGAWPGVGRTRAGSRSAPPRHLSQAGAGDAGAHAQQPSACVALRLHAGGARLVRQFNAWSAGSVGEGAERPCADAGEGLQEPAPARQVRVEAVAASGGYLAAGTACGAVAVWGVGSASQVALLHGPAGARPLGGTQAARGASQAARGGAGKGGGRVTALALRLGTAAEGAAGSGGWRAVAIGRGDGAVDVWL